MGVGPRECEMQSVRERQRDERERERECVCVCVWVGGWGLVQESVRCRV